MALLNKPLNMGNLRGTIYDFEEVGDVLPMHWHRPENTHITIVAKGSFMVKGVTWEKTLVAGNVVDWPAYQQHEFVALEDNSRLVNISKGSGETINEYGDPPKQ
jgi:quercetin dioxygenase-like cupin family protein